MKAIAFFDIEISDRSFRYYFGVTFVVCCLLFVICCLMMAFDE